MTKSNVLDYVLFTLNITHTNKRYSRGLHFELLGASSNGVSVEVGENKTSWSVTITRMNSTGVPQTQIHQTIKKDDWWLTRWASEN